MKYMHNKIAIGLFFINLIVLTIIPSFSIVSNQSSHGNYPSSKLKVFLFIFSLSSLIFLLNFSFSFLTIEKECCSKDDNQNGDCDCCCADCICERTCCVDFYCRCGNNTGSTSGLCYLVPIALLIGLFYLNKPCGKNVSRLVSITALTICEIVFLIMSFIAACQTKFEKFIIINIIISFIGIICNMLGIVLPQFNKFKYLRYTNYKNENIYNEEVGLDYLSKNDDNFTPKKDNLIIEQNKFNNYMSSNNQNNEIYKDDDNKPVLPSINEVYQNSSYNTSTGYDNNYGNVYDAPPAGY